MSAQSLLAEIREQIASSSFDWRQARERIHDEHTNAEDPNDRAMLVALHMAVMDQVERTGIEPGGLSQFKEARAQDYALLIVKEVTVNGHVLPHLLDAVTQREVMAGRMSPDHELRVLAKKGLQTPTEAEIVKVEPPTSISLRDRFRMKRRPKSQQEPRGGATVASPLEGSIPGDNLFRREVVRLYELGVDPAQAVRALLHPKDGTTIEVKRLIGIWLGVNDLLDKVELVNPMRADLMAVEGVLGNSLADMNDEARAYVSGYRNDSRKIREMRVLQSYRTTDELGNADLTLVRAMVTDLEQARTIPGSMAQSISKDKMASLNRLIAHWEDPSELHTSLRLQPE